MIWQIKRKSKFGNKKIKTADNGSFDSKLELSHYEHLLWLEKAKKIKDLQRQVSIKLAKSPKCRVVYKADFVYFDIENKEWVVMDSKGFQTDVFRLKKNWFLDTYSNFRFEIWFNRKKEVFYPYSADGVDFDDYIKNYKKM